VGLLLAFRLVLGNKKETESVGQNAGNYQMKRT